MKILKHIIKNIDYELVNGSLEIPIKKITADSRNVEENTLFVAIEGTRVDGHKFITSAIEHGATAVLVSKIDVIPQGITIIRVSDTSEAMAYLLAAFYDYPSKRMTVVGITGTNGKTTIATSLYNLFTNLGHKCGLISTVEYRIGEKIFASTHTTPNAEKLCELFAQMYKEGVQYVFMEVSSHALIQKRTAAIDFDGAIFTNLTHDHLDYHQTFKNYINAKKILFDSLKKSAFALVNADDKHHKYLLQNTVAHKYTYALKSLADFKAKIIEKHFEGTLVDIDNTEVWLQFVGTFNVYNLLAVYGAARLLGKDKQKVLIELSRLKPVRGRFQIYKSHGKYAIVDYAHTPDALQNILKELVQIKSSGAKIITVVGAGGNRDREKRPKMAAIAAFYSDILILTSDNPRDEKPEDIIADMEKGIHNSSAKYFTIVDREQAIKAAVNFASQGDLILIAGKGHETYQEIQGKKYPFDDMEKVIKYL